ncbi:unnamed protein product [Linum trigynum]|uniref:Uncharacterized protein n=1 Tax=Linum trigynum TaxID=586398 RepID=A0AAV2EH40_9ROSI
MTRFGMKDANSLLQLRHEPPNFLLLLLPLSSAGETRRRRIGKSREFSPAVVSLLPSRFLFQFSLAESGSKSL